MGITRQQALDCFASDDLIGIGMEADAIRRQLHPEGVVSYALDPAIQLAADVGSIHTRIADAVELGATGLVLHGGATHPLHWLERLFASIKQRNPDLRLHCLSAPEVEQLAEASSLTVAETLTRLRAAGLDAMTGDGASLSRPEPYLDVHRSAHQAGVASTAAMLFGAGESAEQRVALLEALHSVQQETAGFLAFTLSAHHPPGGRDLDDPTAVEYLKTLAICRMVLDNIPHFQADSEQQGLKVLQMALRFGGNDAGSVLSSKSAGSSQASEEEIRRLIRDAGFKPAQRDSLFRTMFLN